MCRLPLHRLPILNRNRSRRRNPSPWNHRIPRSRRRPSGRDPVLPIGEVDHVADWPNEIQTVSARRGAEPHRLEAAAVHEQLEEVRLQLQLDVLDALRQRVDALALRFGE